MKSQDFEVGVALRRLVLKICFLKSFILNICHNKPVLWVKTTFRLLLFCSTSKEVGGCLSVLTSKKLNKLKNQHLFLDLREVRSQSKPLPPNLEKQAGYKESPLSEAGIPE